MLININIQRISENDQISVKERGDIFRLQGSGYDYLYIVKLNDGSIPSQRLGQKRVEDIVIDSRTLCQVLIDVGYRDLPSRVNITYEFLGDKK